MVIFDTIWMLLGYIVPFVVVLSTVVFIHEMGHFLVGRWCGVKIDAFSLGIGPELFGFDDRHGTHWRLALYPVGGYVKFHGDANGASVPDAEAAAAMPAAERALTLQGQPVGNRAAIVAAGPVANFLLTVAIFTGLFYFNGEMILQPRISAVVQGSAAELAGFKAGDFVLSIDGRPVSSFKDMSNAIVTSPDIPLTFEVDRAGAKTVIVAAPRSHVEETNIGRQRFGRLGLRGSEDPADLRKVEYDPVQAFVRGMGETWYWVENTGTSIKRLVTGKASADQISGPIQIARVSGEMAKVSFGGLIALIAILSVSIGLLNLMPVPMLDGGHLMFYAYEALRGRPMNERVQEIGFRLGIAAVAALMLFAVSNDLFNIIRDMKIFGIG